MATVGFHSLQDNDIFKQHLRNVAAYKNQVVLEKTQGWAEFFVQRASWAGPSHGGGYRKTKIYDQRVTVVNNNNVGGSSRKTEQEKKDEANSQAMWIGIAFIIGAAGLLGYNFGHYKNTLDEKAKLKAFKAFITPYASDTSVIAQCATAIFNDYKKLLDRRFSQDQFNCGMSVTLIVGGTFLAVGGFAGSSGAVAVGGALLVATVAVQIFKTCYSCTRKDDTLQICNDIETRGLHWFRQNGVQC